MESQKQCIADERELHRERSIQLVYSLPLPAEPKSDSEEGFGRNWSREDLQQLELTASKHFRHMVRRSQRLGNRAEAGRDPLTSRSVEDPVKDASNLDVGLGSSQHNGLKALIPAHGSFAAELSYAQRDPMANPETPTIMFSVDKQAPAEVRTGYVLPAIVVSLERSRSNSVDGELTFDDGSLWGQASLVCAGGRVAMAQSRADILTGDSLVAPLLRDTSQMSNKECWTLIFNGLVIHEPGYFRIHIALIGTSQDEGGGHGSFAVNPPTEQLSVDTSLFRVHGFAPALEDTSEQLPLCCLVGSE
ncbi:hypothetical protein N7G274_001409 [Stereocaulon virgatum]|uniref:Velvet domain-containing protein n=1 Tax=Stereocaulon virgatum TaxID=373712 RepID=A0ABR4AQI6_9LECA